MKNIVQKLNSWYVRLLVILTLTLALLGVLVLSVGIAATDVYFTSVNDKLLPLSESDMPENLSGAIYVPYDIFNSNDLGVSVFYASSTKTIRISNGITDLYFDIKNNNSYDADEIEYPYAAMTRNGKPYLPVNFVCHFLDLTFSVINTDIAPIVRITSGIERYDNTRFAEQAEKRMRVMYDAYAQKHQTNGGNPTVTQKPAENVTMSLTLIGANDIDKILDAVTGGNAAIPTTFIFTADDIRENADAVRRAIGSEVKVAIVFDDANPESEQAARAYLREAAEIVPSEVYSRLPEPISIVTAIDALNQRWSEHYTFTFDTNSDDWSLTQLNQLIANSKY